MSPLSVLAPHDRSPLARRAIVWARRLAGPCGRVILLDLQPTHATRRQPDDGVGLRTLAEPPLRRFVGTAFGECGPLLEDDLQPREVDLDAGLDATSARGAADLAEVVLRAAERVAPDLLLMSRHQAASPRQLAFDAIARAIASKIAIPVALLGPEADPPREAAPGAAIVVGLDGSVKAEAGIGPAMALAEAAHARLHLVCAVDTAGDEHASGETSAWPSGRTLRAMHLAQEYLQALAVGLRARGVATSREVILGSPGELLAAAACKRRTLAAVVAARRPSGGDDVPTVARALLRDARCPTVIVPPPAGRLGDYYGPPRLTGLSR